ncbi:hypothetical protein BDM02DRAFT_3117320 [Thelephora ganbajun]|uniref:Uncharacterized protein n=1 Tax=Thelephora ganbajun TaxID=370292 RepID=A0ACB6ZC82_THEGA|nr:hypothetical protein BDM02DRAFT_3117320 [Thelephora ganbajun]
MVGDDGSDILGGDKLPVGRYQPPSYWSTLSGLAKLSLYSVTFLLTILFLRTFYHRFLRWRETNYRKGTRRRHGIPDTDNRPFNVAYAAALTARKENEARKNLQLRQRTLGEASPVPSPTRRSFGLDARQPLTSVPGGLGSYPIRSPSVAGRARSSLGPAYGQQSHLYPINTLTGRQDNVSASSNRSNRSSPRKSSRPQTSSPLAYPQPLVNEDENSETEVIEQPVEEYYSEEAPQSDEDYEMNVGGEGDVVPVRGAKRLASPDDEDDFDDSFVTQRRDKRARKISREHPPILEDDLMANTDADVGDESHTSPRGKKRDRGDAASTFGGDEDSLMDDSDDKHKRNRRRRTVSTRKPRGQKRGRESHTFESGSDGEIEFSIRGSRKKRGKKAVAQEDSPLFEPPYSTDPLCKGRRVGEEWEIGGTRYKVGPNGDRLQQALVKRKRPKYKMPSDSQHPDKDVMIEVVVEAWLTEDEYKFAKERFELAWQDPPTVDVEMETPSEPQTPVKGGKALLWSSTTSHVDSPIPERRPFRQSITTNVGLPLPASPQVRAPGKGRISTPVYNPVAVGLDSPRLKHVKSFSKWEKQDMEAEAMSKIRQKLQDQKKVTEDEKKPSPAPAPTPAISFQPAMTTSTTSTTTPGLFTSTSATSAQPKLTTGTTTETKELTKNLFATPTPAPTSSTTVPAPVQPAVPNFFTKPATTTMPTSTTKFESSTIATSIAVPNFFSKPAAPAPPTTVTSNITATPAPTFSFPMSQPTPATTTGVTSTTKSTFTLPAVGSNGSGPSFFAAPKPVEQPKQPQSTVTPTSVANIPSLAARLGPQVTNTPTPAQNMTKPISVDLPGATTMTSTTSALEPPNPADSIPKFSFGFTKPSTPATSTTSATTPTQITTTSTVPPFGKTSQSQPVPSPFGATSQPTPSPFGATGQPIPLTFGTQPTPSQPASQPSQPMFSFVNNKPAGGSDPKVALPSTTSVTPATPGTSLGTLAFAPKQDGFKPGPSPLANGSVFGTTSTPVSVFGTMPPAPAPANKPAFPFEVSNTPGAATTSTTTSGTTGSKPPLFVFTPVTPSTSTGGGNGSPFNFRAMGQGQSGTTPAAFGFGAPNQTPFAFGKPTEQK